MIAGNSPGLRPNLLNMNLVMRIMHERCTDLALDMHAIGAYMEPVNSAMHKKWTPRKTEAGQFLAGLRDEEGE